MSDWPVVSIENPRIDGASEAVDASEDGAQMTEALPELAAAVQSPEQWEMAEATNRMQELVNRRQTLQQMDR